MLVSGNSSNRCFLNLWGSLFAEIQIIIVLCFAVNINNIQMYTSILGDSSRVGMGRRCREIELSNLFNCPILLWFPILLCCTDRTFLERLKLAFEMGWERWINLILRYVSLTFLHNFTTVSHFIVSLSCKILNFTRVPHFIIWLICKILVAHYIKICLAALVKFFSLSTYCLVR